MFIKSHKKAIIISLFCVLCGIGSYLGYKQWLHMTLSERYTVCYEKITKMFENLYRCELIQDKNKKDDCLTAIQNNELITTLESGCSSFISEIDINDCSGKYNKDANGIRTYKCVLDKLGYDPAN